MDDDALLLQHAASTAPASSDEALLLAHAKGAPVKPPVAPIAATPKPSPSMSDVVRNGIWKGAAGFGDMVGNLGVNLANLGIAGYGVGKHVLTGSSDLPDLIPSDALSGYSKLGHAAGLIDDSKEPTTGPQRFADFAGQVAGGGGLNPASLARSAVRNSYRPIVRDAAAATGSALGGATGQELTRDVNTGSTSLDNLVKAVATFGGGMAPGGIAAARGSASDRAAAALRGVSPEQLAQAKALAGLAADKGAPVTGYEAIQGITGLNPKMQTQQRIAEQGDSASGGLTQMMQGRPGANQALIDAVTGEVAPPNNFPDTLAGGLQKAAGGAIQSAKDQGKAAAQPFYAKSSNDPSVTIPQSDWNTLTADPAVSWALGKVKNDPLLGVTDAQPGSLQWLDTAKKYLDSHANAKSQAGDNFPASQASRAADLITSTVDPLNPDYAKARQVFADNMKNNVEPMEQSQVGKLSRSDSFRDQANTLLPNNPADVTPQVVSRTASTINAQDPNIMRQFVAHFLRGQYNEAAQQNIAGPNVFGGSKFAAQVAGNPMQEKNLVAALTASGANPQQMMEALQIFRAQGMKPAVNSATMPMAAEAGAMAPGSMVGAVKAPVGTALGVIAKGLGLGSIDAWRNNAAGKDLASALSSGKSSVGDLESLARTNGAYSPIQQQLLINLLMANRDRSANP